MYQAQISGLCGVQMYIGRENLYQDIVEYINSSYFFHDPMLNKQLV